MLDGPFSGLIVTVPDGVDEAKITFRSSLVIPRVGESPVLVSIAAMSLLRRVFVLADTDCAASHHCKVS